MNVLLNLLRDARARFCFGLWPLLLILLQACSAPRMELGSELGRKAIKSAVNVALVNSDCTTAIDLIEPLYSSVYTDDETRFLRASAHACNAGLNYFEFIDHLTTNNLAVPAFWSTITEFFYTATTLDQNARLYSSLLSMDALQAILKPGTVVAPSDEVSSDTNNVGTVEATDRTDDSNSYVMLVAMSTIGAYHSREGDPDLTSYDKQQSMADNTFAEIDEDACGYAGSILNMLDGINTVGDQVGGDLGTSLTSISTTLQANIDLACDYGCRALDWDGVTAVPADAADCANAVGDCNPCPTVLRTRTSCASDAQAKCAAAGMIRFMNDNPLGWQ